MYVEVGALRTSGTATSQSTVTVPRAFFRKRASIPSTIPRTPAGSPVVIASPLASSPRFTSATAWIESRVIAHPAAVGQLQPHAPGLEPPHARAERPAVRHHATEHGHEEPWPEGEWRERAPQCQHALAGETAGDMARRLAARRAGRKLVRKMVRLDEVGGRMVS